MEGFEEKLNSLLSSPDSMEQLMKAAQALMGNSSSPEPSQSASPSVPSPISSLPDPAMLQKISQYMSAFSQPDNKKTALLAALKPYLKPERAAKIDSVVRIAGLIKVAKTAMSDFKGGGLNL